jgi:hypothetical protein
LTLLERLLRLVAISIAIAAAIDPTVSSQGKPRVAVVAGSGPGGALARDVQTALAARFDVTTQPDPSAPAWVVVSPVTRESDAEWPVDAIVSAVLPDLPRFARFERVTRPATVHESARAMVTARVHARGVRQTTSTVVLRSGPLELARRMVRWSTPDEHADVQLDAGLPHNGANHLTIELVDSPVSARADLVIVSTDAQVPVLIFEARPSWAATFVRRALERDARFEVEAVTRVATGITSGRPNEFTRAALDRYAVLVIGGADGLTTSDVERIERFARVRGGSVLFALDRAPSGPVVSLAPTSSFDVRRLDAPATLAVGAGQSIAAREWAIARGVHRGGTVVEAEAESTAIGAGLVRVPLGIGRLVFVGALDAWQLREDDHRRFDRAWTSLVGRLAAEVPPPISVTLDRDVAAPGEPLVARAELAGTGDETLVRASLESGSGNVLGPLRFWPDGSQSRFTSRLKAPRDEGAYAVTVVAEAAESARIARVPFIVARGANSPNQSREALKAIVESHGGVVVHSGEIARLAEHLDRRLGGRGTSAPWHPMRAPWWLAVFTACLGGEWWLRRRAGRR